MKSWFLFWLCYLAVFCPFQIVGGSCTTFLMLGSLCIMSNSMWCLALIDLLRHLLGGPEHDQSSVIWNVLCVLHGQGSCSISGVLWMSVNQGVDGLFCWLSHRETVLQTQGRRCTTVCFSKHSALALNPPSEMQMIGPVSLISYPVYHHEGFHLFIWGFAFSKSFILIMCVWVCFACVCTDPLEAGLIELQLWATSCGY